MNDEAEQYFAKVAYTRVLKMQGKSYLQQQHLALQSNQAKKDGPATLCL